MEIFIFWFAFSVIAGVVAGAKGRSGAGYFFLSIVLSPLVGIVAAALMPRIEPQRQVASIATEPGRIPCPECAELILPTAKICKHCGSRISTLKAIPSNTKADDAGEIDMDTLMNNLGIARDGTAFTYNGNRYDNLADALAYVRKQKAK